MAFTGRRFRRRKTEQIFVEGYYIDHADVFTPGLNAQDETMFLFGRNDPATDKRYDVGTLQITLKDLYPANQLEKILTDHDPDGTGVIEMTTEQMREVSLFVNVKNQLGTAWIKSMYIPNWSAGLAPPSGNPNDKTDRVFTGNSGLPRMFDGAWINTVKVASGGAMALGVTPVELENSGIFAVSCQVIDETAGFDMEEIPVTAAMVDLTGAIDDAEITAQLGSLTQWTDAFFFFLQTGSGVYPNVIPGKLRA